VRGLPASRYRWFILAVFVLSTAISFLDRQTLSALAPEIQREFALDDTRYGLILAAYSIPYAVVAPFAGLLIDRIGLTLAISLALGLWSCAGIATGLTRGLGSLIVCRAILGAAEAAGIPAAGKAIAMYAKPEERAMGHAVNQAAVSFGSMMAPLFAAWILPRWGWRAAFLVTGALGLAWIPLWRTVGRESEPGRGASTIAPYRDRRLWAIVAANALHALPYSLWFGWTTKYLVTVFQLDTNHANLYAWIPPAFALVGGFLAGWASMRIARPGVPVVDSRYRVCVATAVVALATAAAPLAPSPSFAAATISLAIAAVAGFSVNLYALPLDIFGESRAAFAISMLVASFGATTALVAPAIGWTREHYGYAPVTAVAAVTPLLACLVLRTVRDPR
jgi:MFS transporter, ACS family, hexuronate transporter